MRGLHVQVFQVQPGLRQEGREVGEEQREGDHLAADLGRPRLGHRLSPNRCGRSVSGVTCSRCVSCSNSASSRIRPTMAPTSRGSAARRVKWLGCSCAPILSPRADSGRQPPGTTVRRMTHQRLRRAPPGAQPLRRRCAACATTCYLWGDPALATPERPPLVLLHGWMDVGASFQFVVDALRRASAAIARARLARLRPQRAAAAPTATGSPTTWATWTRCSTRCRPAQPVDLLGHSMGGNVVMIYAGVRPERVRRLINLEGFGMPRDRARAGAQAPAAVARRAEDAGRSCAATPAWPRWPRG